MSPESQGPARTPYGDLLRGAIAFLAVLVVARFEFEIVGLPHDMAQYVSATVGMLFVAIYVAAVGPLRGGLQKFSQLFLPAFILSAWTQAWVMVATIIAAVLRLKRSHFAEPQDYGNWGHLGRHLLGHVIEIGIFFIIILLLMAAIRVLWRWPITVAPGALLGVFVIMRLWTEVMGVEAWRAAAWSSTILVLLSALYIGGVGASRGLTTARKLLAPSLALGLVWRYWVYLATLDAALVPSYKTHFFDRSQGHIAARLIRLLGASVIEGLIAGLILWGIAVWISRATRPRAAT